MSGLDMRKIMENLNTETPKVKLNESLGGTPMANDIMALAARLEAIETADEAEELAENIMDPSEDITRKVNDWMDIHLEGRGNMDDVVNLIIELMSYLPEEQVAQLMSKYQVVGDAEGED